MGTDYHNAVKRMVLLAISLSTLTTISFAQQTGGNGVPGTGASGTIAFNGVPTGNCSSTQTGVDTTTGNYYSCNNGAWQKVGPGAGGAPTGTAGGALAGTYPSPTLAAQAANTLLGNNTGSSAAPAPLTISQVAALLSLGTAASQPASAFDTSGAASAAQAASLQKAGNLSDLASASAARTNLGLGTAATQASTAFDASGAAATAQANAIAASAPSSCANGSYACSASPNFTGTPTAPTQPISTNNTDIATTAAVTIAIAGLSGGGSSAGATITPAIINRNLYADGVNGPGIGVAQVAYNSSATYSQCQAVSNSGANYLAVNPVPAGTTPGSNALYWWQVPNANTPTQYDCAFYIAASRNASLSTGANLVLSENNYTSCIGTQFPTVTSPGAPTVSVHGLGPQVSTIQQTCAISQAMWYLPDAVVNYQLARFEWEGFTLDANFNAPAVLNLYGAQQSILKNIDFRNATPGSDHYVEFGDPTINNTGWDYELDLENLQTGSSIGSGVGFAATAAVSAGVPTITITNGGSGYTQASVVGYLAGNGINDNGCGSPGTTTVTVTSGVITGYTTTATGCSAPVYPVVYGGVNINYGFKFSHMTDSHMVTGLTDGQVGAVAGIYVGNVSSFNTFYKVHPIRTMNGIQDNGTNNWFSPQLDSIFRAGMDIEQQGGQTNIYGAQFEWDAATYVGSDDYYFGKTPNPPINAPQAVNIYGDSCAGTAPVGYSHLRTSLAIVDAGSILPPFVSMQNTQYCNQVSTLGNVYPNYVGQNLVWSNGTYGNNFTWNFGSSGNNTMALFGAGFNSGASQGKYTFQFANPTPATSVQNFTSPLIQASANYWNGTNSTNFTIGQQLVFAAGINPAATYVFSAGGTNPGSGLVYNFVNGQIQNQVATGTPPLIVASQTQVANLQAAFAGSLFGCTQANPGDVCYYTGSTWQVLAGNTSGTQVLQETSAGVPSWNTYLPQTGNAVVTPSTGGPIALLPTGAATSMNRIGALYILGDSFAAAFGVTNYAQSYAGLLQKDTPAPVYNVSAGATVTSYYGLEALNNFDPNPNFTTVSLISGTENDGGYDTCGGGFGTTCMKHFLLTENALIGWLTIPYSSRTMGSTCTRTTGSFNFYTGSVGPNGFYLPANYTWMKPQTTIAMQPTTNGAVLTCTVTTPTTATKMGINYGTTTGSTTGFTVAIDGTLETDLCSGTTTFSNVPCAAYHGTQAIGMYRQEYTVTPGTTHTIVFTQTVGTNGGSSLWSSVDWIIPNSASNNVVFQFAENPAWGYAANYSTSIQSVLNQYKADGIAANYVDTTNGITVNGTTYTVNGTTDVSATATATCSGSTTALHPNSCGHEHYREALQAAEYSAIGPTGSAPFIFSSPSKVNNNGVSDNLTANGPLMQREAVTAVASAATIAFTNAAPNTIITVTGTTPITQMTPPPICLASQYVDCFATLLFSSAGASVATGGANYGFKAGVITTAANTALTFVFDNIAAQWFPTNNSTVTTAKLITTANCASGTSPAVCAAASSGVVAVPATGTTLVVNTTAVTATSQIQLTFDSSLSTALGVTCNTTPNLPTASARTAGASFTITMASSITTNPACISYTIIN